MILLDGKKIAAQIRKEIKKDVAKFTKRTGVVPNLLVINASPSPASDVYVRHKKKACEEVGIECEVLLPFGENASAVSGIDNPEKYLIDYIREVNAVFSNHGILVQLPLPDGIDEKKIFDHIPPEKDVDVFHPENVGLLLQDRARFLTCTPHAIHVLLERYNIGVLGKKVVVINSSNIVGKPLFALLIHAGATVTVCHEYTPSDLLKDICLQADIVIVAVGIPRFLTADMVRRGATVVDVGISRIGKKVIGDVDFENVKKIAGAISCVPGGVGPLTICMLLKNTLHSAQEQLK